MAELIYISRNYTEIGPFTPAEILDFSRRSILRGDDHVRYHGHNDWLSVAEWTGKADILSIIAQPEPPRRSAVKEKEKIQEKVEDVVVESSVKKPAKKTAKKATAKKAAKSK